MAAKPVPAKKGVKEQQAPLFDRLPPVVLAWLIPGAGHYYLKLRVHAAVLLVTIVGMFLTGILMQGPHVRALEQRPVHHCDDVRRLCGGPLHRAAVLSDGRASATIRRPFQVRCTTTARSSLCVPAC